MTNEPDATEPKRTKAPVGRLRRWRHRVVRGLVIAIAVLLATYLLLHFVYPRWLQRRVPDDAPRIAFSLDNSLLGRIGITDVTYQRAMAKVGAQLVTLRPDAAGAPEVDAEAVKTLLREERIDGVLLTGGGDVDPNLYGGAPGQTMLVHRLRDDFEIALIRAARQADLPILGICRGCQIINVALGGTVRNLRTEQDPNTRHLLLKGHPVELAPDSALAGALGVTSLPKVASLHGQAVGELGDGVRSVATGPGPVSEAIEADTPGGEGWILGIQWHPELTLDDPTQQRIFELLVERARTVQQRR